MTDYEACFRELSRNCMPIVLDEVVRIHRFVNGLTFCHVVIVQSRQREGFFPVSCKQR